MVGAFVPQPDPPGRSEFSRFFRAKYWRLLQAAFNRNERRPDYADIAVVEAIAVPFRALANIKTPPPRKPVPRHIWMLWQQGWDKAPPIVAACARSWADKNPGWKIHLLDDKSLPLFAPHLDDIKAPKASRTARANLARLSLLAEHGGVWADATLFCQVPLDEWLPKITANGLFMFSNPRPYRRVDIWFMAATRHHPAILAWRNLVEAYWTHFSRPHHYYWMEYLFEMLCARNEAAERSFQTMRKLSALGPLVVQGRAFDAQAPEKIFDLIAAQIVPVHKLSHKWRRRASLHGTPVGALTGLEKV